MNLITDNDFITVVDEDTDVLAIMDDNDRVISYGHLDEAEMYAIAEDYLKLVALEDDLDQWFDGHEVLSYRWVRFIESGTYKFLNDGDEIEDEDAPVTVLQF